MLYLVDEHKLESPPQVLHLQTIALNANDKDSGITLTNGNLDALVILGHVSQGHVPQELGNIILTLFNPGWNIIILVVVVTKETGSLQCCFHEVNINGYSTKIHYL